MTMFERRWTATMDAELDKRIEGGESFSVAARAMGVTKNAAIGRYNRIGGYSRKKESPLGEAWPLRLCAELPMGLTDYVPVNPRVNKRV